VSVAGETAIQPTGLRCARPTPERDLCGVAFRLPTVSVPDRFKRRRGIVQIRSDAIVFDESVGQLVWDTYCRYWCADEAWQTAVFVGYVTALVYGTAWGLGAVAAGELLLPKRVMVGDGTLVLGDRVRGVSGRDHIRLAAIRGSRVRAPRLVSPDRASSSSTVMLVPPGGDGASCHRSR
jgi:hypothetical protein